MHDEINMHVKAVKIRVKKMNSKITIKQTMLSPSIIPSGVAICRDSDFFGRASRPAVPRGFRGRQRRAVEMGLFIAVKFTTIILRSHHLVLRLLGTYWSARV